MAVLYVTKAGGQNLEFLLYTGAAAAFRQGMHLTDHLRQQIEKSLADFASCVKGEKSDEQELCTLGKILYRLILPLGVRQELGTLEEPLSLFTDDPSLPWEILHDDKDFLSLRYPFARQLILQDRLRGLLRPAAPAGSGLSALVIADPTRDLPGALKEGEAVYEFFHKLAPNDSDLLAGGEATWTSIQARLVKREYAVIHYCGHIDSDRATGQPLMRLLGGWLEADAVLRVFRGSPVVFLNACYSDGPAGGHAPSASLTETFAQAFMLGNEEGVASAVVGAMWRIPDEPEEAGREFTLAFYRRLLEGHAIADALRAARLLAREEKKWGPMVWGPYVLYGDPRLVPFPAQPLPTRGQVKPDVRSGAVPEPEPPVVVPPVVPPTPPHPGPKPPEDSVSLDGSSRVVLRAAVRECTRMKQGGISTLHLLIGLCDPDAGVKPLGEALAERGVSAETICKSLRSEAERLLPGAEQRFGVSHNVLKVLSLAAQQARVAGRDSITAQDVLAALLDWGGGAALRVLAEHGVEAAAIERRLPQVRIGPLAKVDCAPDAWRVLWMAVLRSGGRPLDSTHLFRAMLREPEGCMERAFRRLGIDPEAVRNIVRQQGLGE
jgi:hypothetical protein